MTLYKIYTKSAGVTIYFQYVSGKAIFRERKGDRLQEKESNLTA
jgi:hypothetical protein